MHVLGLKVKVMETSFILLLETGEDALDLQLFEYVAMVLNKAYFLRIFAPHIQLLRSVLQHIHVLSRSQTEMSARRNTDSSIYKIYLIRSHIHNWKLLGNNDNIL